MLELDLEAKQRLRTTVSRADLKADQASRDEAASANLLALETRMLSKECGGSAERCLLGGGGKGGQGAVCVAGAAVLSHETGACCLKAGWVRHEKKKNVFSRAWCVLWEPPPSSNASSSSNCGGGGWPRTGDDSGSSFDVFLLLFPGPEAKAAEAIYRLGQGRYEVAEPKKQRKNCEHCLRLDGSSSSATGTDKSKEFKLVFGADTEAETQLWREVLEKRGRPVDTDALNAS